MARAGKGGCGGIFGIFAIVAVYLLVLGVSKSSRAPRPSPTPIPQTAPSSSGGGVLPALNPIREALKTGEAPLKDGIAVAVLVDTSGSMEKMVKDTDGSMKQKINLACRAVLDIVRLAAEYRKKNPATPLYLDIREFSARGNQPNVRPVVPVGEPNPAATEAALRRLVPGGGTPIGDAMIEGKLSLDKLALKKIHLVVVTDGQNTHGYQPGDVADAISTLPEEHRASVYFVAFDTDANYFEPVRTAGGIVLSASNAQELNDSLQYVFSGKILVEQPVAPEPAKP